MKQELVRINSVDLWTEQHDNHYECFNGAFVDGFENSKVVFDEYKIVRNCNCIITVKPEDINIRNKHNAIVFYKNNIPVRLMVINQNTNIDKCIDIAFNQSFGESILKDLYQKLNIKSSIIDMKEKPINNNIVNDEVDVGSCDRWPLLYNMLQGLYTETNNTYGNFSSDKYYFIPDLFIKYDLTTDTEKFEIEHKCAFINTTKTRLIPIQENSSLTRKENLFDMNINIKRVKIFVTVPLENVEEVRNAICDAGAGIIGNYTYCTSSTKSIGTFIPNESANPHIGQRNKLEYVEEKKLEVVCDVDKIKNVLVQLRKVHPYEEPAIDIVPLLDEADFK